MSGSSIESQFSATPLFLARLLAYNQGMAVLAMVDDLFFRAKIEAAAKQAGVSVTIRATVEAAIAPPAEGSWQLVIVDLHLSTSDPIETISALRRMAPTTPMLGYGSHVEAELHARARAAGCTDVLPRSVFVQRLPALLSGK